MPCGATQDGRVMVERSDRMWSIEEENDKPLQYSCLKNPMNSVKRQKDTTLRDEPARLVDVHTLLWKIKDRAPERMKISGDS